MTLYSAAFTLLLIMDPLGNIPLFLSILNKVAPQRRQYIILRESLIALIVLILFLFFGRYILEGMRISSPAITIAGGIILFLIALRMIFPHSETHGEVRQEDEPFIVPLAIPLLAGPSTMTMVMLLARQAPHAMDKWLGALLAAWIVSTIILLFASYLRRVLGQRGLIAIERLMGMILTMMAVQMFLTGVKEFFQ